MFRSKHSQRSRRTGGRKLALETLFARRVFSTDLIATGGEADEAVVEVAVNDATLGTFEFSPVIDLSLGDAAPGDYHFSFSFDINVTITSDDATTVIDVETPIAPTLPEVTEPPTDVGDAPLVAPETPPTEVDDPIQEEPQDLLQPSVRMTPQEQLLLELVNRARRDPAAEASLLGIELNEGVDSSLISAEAKQPLAPNQMLIDAAGRHSADMLERDFFSHTNLDGESPSDRAAEAGFPVGVGENIAWGGSTDFDVDPEAEVYQRHEDLIVSPDHRRNLLSNGNREVGIDVSYGELSVDGLDYNASIVTQKFGTRGGNSFITGVVFDDSVVADNFFTIGEETDGGIVTAIDSAGVRFATEVGPSGGYALQVPNGSYTVSLSNDPESVTVLVLGQNEKVDFNLGEPTMADVPLLDPPVAEETESPSVHEPVNPPAEAPILTSEDCEAPLDESDQTPPLSIETVGQQFFVETFESGEVNDEWTEFTPLAPTQIITTLDGDREFQVSHVQNEDRVVLRKELADFDSVYATYETTFVSGFDQPWWSLKQARLYHEAGTSANAGTVDFAIWGLRRDYGDSPFVSYVYQDTGEGSQVPIEFPAHGDPVRVSFYVQQNSPGNEDGRFMIWLDDDLVVDDQAAVLSADGLAGAPTGISFINNLSNAFYGDPQQPMVRNFDDLLLLTDPVVEPELVHDLALSHFRR